MVTPIPDDRRAGLPPPQFRLATLLWGVALLAVLSAMVSYFGAHSALILILFALAVAAHVAGNALGTQLRSNGDRPLSLDDGRQSPARTFRAPTADEFAPTTKLHHRNSLGLPIVIATFTGGVATAILGGLVMLFALHPSPTWTAVIVGTLACCALGAMWTFAAFSFIQVTGGAFWQASRKVDRDSDKSATG